ncbi:MAG: BamA/TamA family outer membrane protein, partial [Gammaproteobacteria bacterium]|nr:BamA/TamA family outer membrane protein [Gammaproteobacteria bacterium]
RFFTGGDRSVRGYGFNALGVTDENGEVIGGRHLLVGSVEYDHAINDQFSVAAFLDTGNAINSLNDDLEQGAGLGVRWKSPVGPVRLDIASAISRPGNPIRVHISVGPDL